MKNIATNKPVGVILMVGLIVLGTFFGAWRSLGKLENRVSQAFYEGVEGDGFCIQADLDERVILANNLATIAARYLPANDASLAALRADASALSQESDIARKYAKNAALSQSAALVGDALAVLTLSESDARYVKSIRADLQSRNDTMANDGYNALADDYNNTLRAFPANLLSALLPVKPAPYFR